MVSGVKGEPAAGGVEQVPSCPSTLICCDSLSRSDFIHSVTQRAALAQGKSNKLKAVVEFVAPWP